MKRQQCARRLLLWAVLMLLALGTLACQEQPTGPRAWIDVPLNGANLPAGTPVAVISHAYVPGGVAEVALAVNGQPYRRVPPAKPGEAFSQANLDWMPAQAGEYVLEVTAYSKSGDASSPARVAVRVRGTPTPVRPVTRVITPATLVPKPDLEIVSVEAIVEGYKADEPFCNTRVTYRNAGSGAVPRDFTIQFHYNGVPTLANTVAGGLAPGASAQIIFTYQFVGSPYIGINLDSTSLITESDEGNNAFANARLCGGPTPVRPTTPARPISITPPPTHTPTPTRVTPPPPPSCSGTPNIASFSASPASIERGNSATLSWGAVTNADSVSLEPGMGGVGTPGSRSVSPQQTTTYTLTARCGSNTRTRQVTINVSTPVPPPPRDTQGPPAPNLRSPRGGQPCVGNVTLDWDAVSDPSGIRDYTVKWVRNDGQSGGTVTGGTSHNISVACGNSYTWSVFATDKAGNKGGTGTAGFSVAGLH